MAELSLVLKFLSGLKRHNNRKWFEKHRAEYEAAKQIFEEFVFDLIQSIGRFDSSITHIEPKHCIFRIHRDVRFSKDKKPYKTNFGAAIAQGGRKSAAASYYIHIEPGASMLGGGVYRPEPDTLFAIRNAIAKEPKTLQRILSDKKFKSYFGALWTETLSRPPKGFDPDHPAVDLLKYKSYVAVRSLKDNEILKKDCTRRIAEGFRIMKSFKKYLDTACLAPARHTKVDDSETPDVPADRLEDSDL